MTRIFVTGTDTGVGKTVVSAWLCAHLQADYWKPVQSGLEDETDSQLVERLSGCTAHPETYRLMAPLSPHQSAALEGLELTLGEFTPPHTNKPLVVEGAGGCLVPLNWQHTMLDLMKQLALPVVLVGRSGLGTINHTCLSLAALKSAGIPVIGVILTGPDSAATTAANAKAIEHFGQCPVLAHLPRLAPLNKAALLAHHLPNALAQALRQQ